MKNISEKTTIFVLALFFLSGAFSWNLYFKKYSQKDTVDAHAFPRQIGEWTAEEIPISDHDYDILETRNAFTRRYTNPQGESVVLFIVYSQFNRKVSHPPEVCYTGSGATFVTNEPAVIRVPAPPLEVRANKILVEMNQYQQYMYYWFKVGDTFTSNYWRQQLLIVGKTLLGQTSGSAMIRLSADLEEGQNEQAVRQIETFAKTIIPLLLKYLP